MKTLKIDNKKLLELLNIELPKFTKYSGPLMNLANRFIGGTKPKVVGQMSELIKEFDGETFKEWENWYLKKYPEAIEAAVEKIAQMLINFKDVLEKISKASIKEWVRDLVIIKTFVGLKNQEAILKSVPEYFKTESRFDISQETKNSIWGISAFILAIISVLSFVGKAGWAGEGFDLIARSLFGWGFFIIPIAFVLLGISFLKSISRNIYSSAVLGTLLFIMAILAVFYIFGKTDFDGRLVQGGYLGIILGFPILESVGFSASLIILLAAIFIALLVTLNVPIYKLISKEEKEEKLVDHVVVKKGNEAVTSDDKKTVQETKPVATVASKQAKPEITDKEFVIKNTKLGNWALPPVELLHSDQEEPTTGDINASANIIKRTLSNFGIDVEMGDRKSV